MTSIIEEIFKVRNNSPILIDKKNYNRYRIVTNDIGGVQTAYYFNMPVYNNKTRKILDLKYHINGDTIFSVGSNSNIIITDKIRLDNQEGFCEISLSDTPTFISEHEVYFKSTHLYPTTNGIAIRYYSYDNTPFKLTFEVSKSFMDIRSNNKYFALMSKKFQPFFVVSCIGAEDSNGNIIAPVNMTYQRISDCKFSLTIVSCTSLSKAIFLEANLYEPKLFQDTTVESHNPETNNVFGSVGFIGTTKEFGEQWLYSRPDYQKMPELNDKRIMRVILHLPKLNPNSIELSSSAVAARFCSFGSTWNSKIHGVYSFSTSKTTDNYIDIDLTPIFLDECGKFVKNDGFILKSSHKNSGFSVISTGDSYYYPEILEVVYR